MRHFTATIDQFIDKWALLKRGDRLLIACSGGVDSVALLHFLASHQKDRSIEVAAVHVDHMLRGEESALDGILVQALCEQLKIPFFAGRIPVPELIEQRGGNVQAVCRAERYTYFSEVMKKNNFTTLVTGHHAEDQLETVLMQVTKGRMPIGMPIKRMVDGGLLIRPFLPCKKADLYAYAETHQLQYREDPSNQSDVYMRNRFRHHILPVILTENDAAAEKLVENAGRLQEDLELLERFAKEQFERIVQFTNEGFPTLYNNEIASMHPALQRRLITLLLNYLYTDQNEPIETTAALIEQLLHHLSNQQGNVSIDLPQGYKLIREYDKLTFTKSSEKPLYEQQGIPKGVPIRWGEMWLFWTEVDDPNGMEWLEGADESMYFNMPDNALPLTVRHRKNGDRILLSGMSQSKRLSRLFIDEKIGAIERDHLPVILTAEGEVCAVPSVRYGMSFSRNRTKREKYIFIVKKMGIS
ncbi:tRNA lysidine(34) synthetase TilS [Sporosarcina sp. HYO08]|uniref:tRNA lysidine(34) synthetase TilS n=1 Tax=Sporosarcina sp. HYO08 TaxID=1759557 RepID=UPI00155F3A60|nr:tRNA lysidine(34) synthetase TilS [Sporosarcina sp. HYO08]